MSMSNSSANSSLGKHNQSVKVEIGDQVYTFDIVVDNRLRTLARWSVQGQRVLVRIPKQTSQHNLAELIKNLTVKLTRLQRKRKKRSSVDLEQRAHWLNQEYFQGELKWSSIRWVSNMQYRLGSCTTGGPTDGDLRISDRIRDWPQYVIDYVIAHEICHRKYPDHSDNFWEYLRFYPLFDKALGFIDGIAFTDGNLPELD